MPDGSKGPYMESFRPGPETARAYRRALGAFGTGVTVVTCFDGDKPLAMTANSFSSVSLDPALVLWSPAVSSSRHDAFVAARGFSIHILAEGQLPLAQGFARDGRDWSRADWTTGATGAPALADALVRLDCTHFAAHGAGDHTIVLGQVEQVAERPGAPLLFVQGAYGGFAEKDFTRGG